MDGIPSLGICSAHVNALNWTCLRALEAGFTLQRAALIGHELKSTTVARRNVWLHFGVHHRLLRLEEAGERECHSANNA
jgi:hypothetical protein